MASCCFRLAIWLYKCLSHPGRHSKANEWSKTMEMTIEVASLSVEPNGRSGVLITVEVNGGDVAEQLLDADRLEGLDVDVVRPWLLANDNHDDILEAIGEEKIHEFLSHSN